MTDLTIYLDSIFYAIIFSNDFSWLWISTWASAGSLCVEGSATEGGWAGEMIVIFIIIVIVIFICVAFVIFIIFVLIVKYIVTFYCLWLLLLLLHLSLSWQLAFVIQLGGHTASRYLRLMDSISGIMTGWLSIYGYSAYYPRSQNF